MYRRKHQPGGDDCGEWQKFVWITVNVYKSRYLNAKFDAATYELPKPALLGEISLLEDNLRIYRLTEPLSKNVKFGKFRATDFDAPLIL